MIATALALLALAAPTRAQAQDTTRFAQGVDYRIEAILDEDTDVLHGRARLRYTNNAPAALDTIWLHQHLNAFRPNSAWARREMEYGETRFQELGPDDHAYERFTAVAVDGAPVTPIYPGAPDSTVVAIPLDRPLQPGASITLEMDWDARLATLPRRQGRAGRHFDFAQWYPRIAVYDRGGWQTQPLLPQGEFYGEYAGYDVTLDVPADQVVGATGVPVEGDPGWGGDATLQRDFYGSVAGERLGLLDEAPAELRKRVRWHAENVHHFAWSANPEYRHEQTTAERSDGGEPVVVHVLYRPGDDDWDDGAAAGRTRTAIEWLQGMFGPYPWPQLTNLHRIESGGTEFPMVIMDGSAGEGLIVHESAHQYVHGIFGNNEWAEGWLDEGFASFLTNWYMEEQGAEDVWAGALRSMAARERAGAIEPIATPGADFRDPSMYSAMTYTRASLMLRMLRELVGEEAMRAALREYYERYALSHVNERDFRNVVEEVSGRDLDWFFDQWLHTTATLDYGIGDAVARRLPDGRWRTTVEVIRLGDAWMPVDLRVGGVTRTLDRDDLVSPVVRVDVVTAQRPTEAVVDPDAVLLDLDPSNNRVVIGADGIGRPAPDPGGGRT